MPNIFEPAPRFERGVHKALEVDTERLDAVLKALDVAYSLGEAAPIVSLINEHVDVTVDPAAFFDSPDGYPACRHLHHYIPQILRADGASIFGLDLLGEIFAARLDVGKGLLDTSNPQSPEWLDASIALDFSYCPAQKMLDSIDFGAGMNEQAVSAASEAFDMGELGDDISGVGDFQVDALDDWAARLRDALADFKFQLEDIAARDGVVLTWYER